MATERRSEIQLLRAIAAIEVVVVHSDLVTKHFSPGTVLQGGYELVGGIGVELFFIVSGFIMCMRAAESRSGWSFMLGRIRRIAPMYWVFTSLILALSIAQPNWMIAPRSLEAERILSSYLILPQADFPPLGPGWTLEHEMIFYALIACALGTLGLKPDAKLAFGWALAVLGAAGCILGPQEGRSLLSFHVLSPYMFAFSFGWLVRCWEERQGAGRLWIAFPYALALGVGLGMSSAWGLQLLGRFLAAGTVFGLFLAGRRMLSADGWLGRAGWELGDASYSIYLAHWFVLSASGKLLGRLGAPPDAAMALRLLGIASAIAVGLLCFRWFEHPLDRRLRELSFSRTRRLPAQPDVRVQRL
ncbi:acyltransferase family protein [Enterovirga aerilata]|uniref:Acyltransferase n=1 Tax=Enterovirga aerilata TaxID=2730920 RepID=A0A849ICB9_9HYPH|nr:acyltransferase [Enterovirga sp. DB1703]NNM74069.1 acyltransferase [Enterovirga sp. DB1703]